MGSEAAQAVHQEDASATTHNSTASDSSRVAEFHAYIAQNANLMVESPRRPGFKAPLGMLFSMCPVPVEEDNVDEFYAEAVGLAASAPNQAENETPNDEAEEVEATEEQTAQEQPESNTANEDMDAKETTEVRKEASEDKQPTGRVGQAASQKSSLGSEIENIEFIGAESTNSIKAEGLSSPNAKAPAEQSHGDTSAAHAQAENSPSTTNVTGVTETSDGAINSNQAPLEIEDVKITEREEAISEQEAEITRAEIKYLPTEDITEEQASETSVKLDELIQEIIGKEELETPQSLQEETSEAVLIDEEVGIGLDTAELTETANDNPTFEIPIIEEVRPVPEDIALNELSDSAEEVEQIMLSVDERLQELAEENTEETEHVINEATEILDEIMALIERENTSSHGLEALEEFETSEGGLEIQEKEEELKEFFAQLFEKLKIDYTPEQLDACVKFAIRGSMEEVLSSDKENEEEALVPDDTGTHEVLKQLITAASNFKRAIMHAYAIGKITLRLCVQHLNPA